MGRNILCVMSDVGGAHRSVANAIHESLQRLCDTSDFTFEVVDLYAVGSRFCNSSIKLYPHVIKYWPRFYGMFYRLTDNVKAWNFMYKTFIFPFMRKNTKKLILENKPDLILSVFALSSRIVVDILRDIDLFDKVPVFVVVVDLFTIHFSWAEPRADLVIVPTEKAKAQLIKYGVPVEKLRVTGLPISSRFNEETRLDRFRKEMNLKEALFTVMIMGGGEGSGDIYEIVDILSKSNLDIQVVVVAGRNKKLENKLRGLKKESNLQMKVFGFTNKIPELMSVSNILITKAGPVTLMEAFSKELPVVITGRVPDQEEGNVEYVRSKNLGYVINEKEEIIDILRRAINFRSELELMRQNIRKERKVNGADKVADLIMRESRYDRAGLGVKKP